MDYLGLVPLEEGDGVARRDVGADGGEVAHHEVEAGVDERGVVGDDDEGSLLLLDSGGDSVDTDGEGSLSGVSGVSLSGGPGI